MRALSLPFVFALALLFTAAGCNSKSVTNPVVPTTPTASFAGTWVGTATDSSGSMMGSGLGNLATMTWVLTQNGAQVTGNISFAGIVMPPGFTAPTLVGTASGSTMTFTITMAAGSMPSPNHACSATASGTMTLATSKTTMAGTYTGTSTCIGGFANGQITLTRQ